MGLVKTRRLAAMQKMQRSKFGKMTPVKKSAKNSKGLFHVEKQSNSEFPLGKER